MPKKNMEIREISAYGMSDITSYVGLKRQTIEYWTSANDRQTIIKLSSVKPPRFSFSNLVELHILSMFKLKGVKLQRIREAVRSLQKVWPHSNHPLLEQDLLTDGIGIFTNASNDLIDESLGGQRAFKEMLEIYLERVVWDRQHGPVSLYPFLNERTADEPKLIQIDPRVGFGRPVIAGTAITTAIVASRFNARESVADLAKEYGRKAQEIEEAIRWERVKAA
jgi:uncharacterized protein (DUF433 family)